MSTDSKRLDMADLAFHPLHEEPVAAERHSALLQEAREVLVQRGMASMDEYGDMLKWGLPKRDGFCRNIHVFHPDWCSYSDAYYGTIHYHAGEIRGTLLLGEMEHHTYQATPDPEGDRFHEGKPHRLTRRTRRQAAGTHYRLPAMVPHWLTPTKLTLTYFEEEDNGEMGDLINPATNETDEHRWDQAQADALLPELIAAIDAALAQLRLTA